MSIKMSELTCPPWIWSSNPDGTADILPAGRPGVVMEGLPPDLAKALAAAASKWYQKIADRELRDLEKKAKKFTKEVDAISKNYGKMLSNARTGVRKP